MPNRDTRNGAEVYIDDEGEVMYPACVGCPGYFDDGPCDEGPCKAYKKRGGIKRKEESWRTCNGS